MNKVVRPGDLHCLILSVAMKGLPSLSLWWKTEVSEQLHILPFSKTGTCTSEQAYPEFAGFSIAQNNID